MTARQGSTQSTFLTHFAHVLLFTLTQTCQCRNVYSRDVFMSRVLSPGAGGRTGTAERGVGRKTSIPMREKGCAVTGHHSRQLSGM